VSLWRTIRFTWKELSLIAFLAISLATSLYQLYRAWALHVIDIPWVRYPLLTATLADQPIWFAISVAFFAAGAVIVAALLWPLVASLRREIANFRIRETRPPLDDAIRQPPDER
jgi:hypothetical protein